jgi:nitrite reductase (cytochrome c-552)
MNEQTPPRQPSTRKREVGILIAAIVISGVVAAGLMALLMNIFERRQEARNPFYRVVDLTDDTIDPEIWGKNFPFQYDDYLRTVDMVRTRFGGSEAMPRTPTEADPRSLVARSKLEEDPRLRTIWAGYPFAHDFRESRGHAYMLDDQTLTGRQLVTQQPGTCLHCHASVYVAYRELGNGDLIKGFERMNAMPFQEARKLVEHPVACIDCHEAHTMELRITRPAFLEGIRALKQFEGVENYDPNTMASRQEMRSFVCAQCHVEYYFQGAGKRLVYPWAKGLKADQILDYFNEVQHADWTHADTGAPSLKVQHPEFELFSQGVHARAAVACADCHMPFKREGAFKISDHQIRSPLLNLNRACQTCHRWPEAELRGRVALIQERTYELRNLAMEALVELIADLKEVRESGSDGAQLSSPLQMQRAAQFYIDFVESEGSMGFHAPQEAARLLAKSIDFSRKGQVALRDLSRPPQDSAALPADQAALPRTE